MNASQGTRIGRLVGFLILSALVFGGILLLMIGQTMSLLNQHRAQVDEESKRVAQTAQRLSEFSIQSQLRINALLAQEGPTNAVKDDFQTTFQAVLKLGAGADDRPSGKILAQIEPLVEQLSRLQGKTMTWRGRYDPIRQDFQQQRTAGQVRQRLLEFREAVEILEGQWRLAEAMQLKAWRAAPAAEATPIAATLLNNLVRRTQTGLADLRGALADLTRITELVAVENEADNLVNLKDNQLKPSLEQFHWIKEALEDNPMTAGKLRPESYQSMLGILLGEGFVFEPSQQTLSLGQGGLFNLRRAFLDLRAEQGNLQAEATRLFAAIDGQKNQFEQAARERTILLDQQVNDELAASWRRMLALGGLVSTLFFWLAWGVRKAIRGQVRDLQMVTQQAEAAREQTHQLMLEQQEAAKKFAALSRQNLLILNSVSEGILGVDRQGTITFVNPAAIRLVGGDAGTWIGQSAHGSWHRTPEATAPSDPGDCSLCEAIRHGIEKRCDTELFWRNDGRSFAAEYAVAPLRDESNQTLGAVLFFRDISGRRQAEQERAQMELQLRQAQKLQSIGHLAAGIAHEINTPVQFIGDNTRFLSEIFGGLDQLLAKCAELIDAGLGQASTAVLAAECAALSKTVDVTYLRAEVPSALQQTLEGIERISKIVGAMKSFSHPGTEEKASVDLNQLVESTLIVCRNEWKYVADLVTEFDPTLTAVPCLPGEFNQVILNLAVNAAHAIADARGTGSTNKGTLTVTTRRIEGWAEVRVTDTGTGIPESVRPHIFDAFFTTKEVGRGTGQGLTLAHAVITEKHGGTIRFETEMGKGTTFILQLPLVAPKNTNGRSQSSSASVPACAGIASNQSGAAHPGAAPGNL